MHQAAESLVVNQFSKPSLRPSSLAGQEERTLLKKLLISAIVIAALVFANNAGI